MRRRKKDRHLPPCVYLKHGAYWFVKNGRWERLGTDLPAILAKYGRKISSHSDSPIGKLIDQALGQMLPTLAKNSAKQYRLVGERLKAVLVEFRPEDVLPRHVAAIKLSYSAKRNMGNNVLKVMRAVFGRFLEWQIIDANPCAGIAAYEEHKRDRYITEEEFSAIRAKADPRLQVIMDLQYLTGQRIGDVLKIRAEDVTDDGIAFRQQKTNTKLVVRWTPELRDAVERARALYGNVRSLKTLLCNRKGNAPDYGTVKQQWDRAAELAGIADAKPNDLRARSLTDVDAAGGDATGLAGHMSPGTTRRYIRHRLAKVVSGPSIRQVSNKKR